MTILYNLKALETSKEIRTFSTSSVNTTLLGRNLQKIQSGDK